MTCAPSKVRVFLSEQLRLKLEDHPTITNFDDFSLWMYVLIADVWQQLGPLFGRPGPTPRCSDSELITMAIVGECRGWEQETELIRQWREQRDLFCTYRSAVASIGGAI
jgi:hypothetical protein